MTFHMQPPKTRGDTRVLVKVSGKAYTYAQIAERMGRDVENKKDRMYVWGRVRALRKAGEVTWEKLGVVITTEERK